MAYEFISAARDRSAGLQKGFCMTPRDAPVPRVWGGLETLPEWIQVRVTTGDARDAVFLRESWISRPVEVQVSETATERRLRYEIRAADVSTSGRGRDQLRDVRMFNWLSRQRGATIVSRDATRELTVDISKGVNLTLLRRQIADLFEFQFETRRSKLSSGFVDMVAAMPRGRIEVTFAELQANVVDRLDE